MMSNTIIDPNMMFDIGDQSLTFLFLFPPHRNFAQYGRLHTMAATGNG